MSKQVAESIKEVASSDSMQLILNRSVDVQEVIKVVTDHWAYDLFSRKPGPAYYDKTGSLQMTDLDLACFLSALVDRKAVICLPHYKARRATTKREGEVVTSKTNRHGKVMGLTANSEVMSFSIRINDMNVIQAGTETKEDSVGAPRNFMLVDVNGTWHEGWDRIEFMPSAKENDFLKDRSLWTGNTIYFKNFVHPNRWSAFYGQHYLLLKALIDRLEEEAKFLRTEVKRVLVAGITYPTSGEGAKKEWPKSEEGESKAIIVKAFECEIDAPFIDSFTKVKTTQAGLVEASKRVSEYTYHVLPLLRFHARATELAFYQKGCAEAGFPSWIKGAEWTTGYRQEGKRTDWNRLVLHQAEVGQIGFALRYRIYDKTERVALNSKE
jgi:hypothetical protein